MSKKRFVEFYLSAMLKAATNGRVTRVAYLYYDLTHTEVVRVEYEHDHGGGVNELPVTGLSLLERAQAMASIAHPSFREELLRYAGEHFGTR